MNLALLITLLLKIATYEWPSVMNDKPQNAKYREGLQTMAELYFKAGSEGAVLSPDADPILLAVIGYEESRHRPKVKDGDCGLGGGCNAIGPMQLARSAPWTLANIDPQWKGMKVEQLRDPQTAVKGSYQLLRYWKQQCPGTPAHWLGAWSAGKCFGKNAIELGVRRCMLAKGMADAAGIAFPACANRKIRSTQIPKIIESLKASAPKAEAPAPAVK